MVDSDALSTLSAPEDDPPCVDWEGNHDDHLAAARLRMELGSRGVVDDDVVLNGADDKPPGNLDDEYDEAVSEADSFAGQAVKELATDEFCVQYGTGYFKVPNEAIKVTGTPLAIGDGLEASAIVSSKVAKGWCLVRSSNITKVAVKGPDGQEDRIGFYVSFKIGNDNPDELDSRILRPVHSKVAIELVKGWKEQTWSDKKEKRVGALREQVPPDTTQIKPSDCGWQRVAVPKALVFYKRPEKPKKEKKDAGIVKPKGKGKASAAAQKAATALAAELEQAGEEMADTADTEDLASASNAVPAGNDLVTISKGLYEAMQQEIKRLSTHK